jgi:hypothetical protein
MAKALEHYCVEHEVDKTDVVQDLLGQLLSKPAS